MENKAPALYSGTKRTQNMAMRFNKEELENIMSSLELQAMGVMDRVTEYALKGLSDSPIAIACKERVAQNYALIKRIKKELKKEFQE